MGIHLCAAFVLHILYIYARERIVVEQGTSTLG